MARAPASGRRLNRSDAAVVKAMIARGDRQHDIAAYFAVNGGRIGETSTGEKFSAVMASTGPLPPAAPYVVLDATLRNEANSLKKELVAAGVSARSISRLDAIIAGMESSRIARQDK